MTNHTLTKISTVNCPDGLNQICVGKSYVLSNEFDLERTDLFTSLIHIDDLLSGTKKSYTTLPSTELIEPINRPSNVEDVPSGVLFGFTDAMQDILIATSMDSNKSFSNNLFTTLTFDNQDFKWNATNNKYENQSGGADITVIGPDNADPVTGLGGIYGLIKFEYNGNTYHAWTSNDPKSEWAENRYLWTDAGKAVLNMPDKDGIYPTAGYEFRLSHWVIVNTTFGSVSEYIPYAITDTKAS